MLSNPLSRAGALAPCVLHIRLDAYRKFPRLIPLTSPEVSRPVETGAERRASRSGSAWFFLKPIYGVRSALPEIGSAAHTPLGCDEARLIASHRCRGSSKSRRWCLALVRPGPRQLSRIPGSLSALSAGEPRIGAARCPRTLRRLAVTDLTSSRTGRVVSAGNPFSESRRALADGPVGKGRAGRGPGANGGAKAARNASGVRRRDGSLIRGPQKRVRAGPSSSCR